MSLLLSSTNNKLTVSTTGTAHQQATVQLPTAGWPRENESLSDTALTGMATKWQQQLIWAQLAQQHFA